MLNQADFKTATWKRFVEGQMARLQELREQNDLQADEIKTAVIRGHIAEVKRTLDLSTDSSNDESHPALRGDDE
jgi:hypothetical protein